MVKAKQTISASKLAENRDSQQKTQRRPRRQKRQNATSKPEALHAASTRTQNQEAALSRIRSLILDGVYHEGDQITDESVLDKVKCYEIGKVSIRRALIELAHEGLVEIRPHSGTFVRSIDPDELYQLWRTRVVLEDFFVTSLARNPRVSTNHSLRHASVANEKLFRLAEDAVVSGLNKETLATAVSLDIEFHDQLAAAAGYRDLTRELMTVRNRLRLAAGPMELTIEQLRQIASDHEQIIKAIRPREGSLIGDVVRARLAINSHLRNAADRQRITSRIRDNAAYGNDPIWDLPRELGHSEKQPSAALAALRILLELLVASEIAKQDTTDRLLIPTELCSKMNNIAKECSDKLTIDDKTKAVFITLDIRFHASLAFLSGLMFADEAISHIWQRLYDDANRQLDGSTMLKVVHEHNKILRALMFYSGNTDEPNGTQIILQHVTAHLLNAYGRAVNGPTSDADSLGPPKEKTLGNTECLPQPVLDFIKWFADEFK